MYHEGLRLRGLDELLLYLDRVEESFKTHPELEKVRTLVWRARGDFEVSTEAALSAMPAVVLDFMRDVMEIELLLRDFASEPARIDEWIRADEQTRWEAFRPAVLRKRYADRQGVRLSDLRDSVDYKGHSAALHVSPFVVPFGSRHIRRAERDSMAADSSFWDIIEHGRRLVDALYELKKSIAPRLAHFPSQRSTLRGFRKAWEATRQMQAIVLALFEAVREVREEPSTNRLPDR
jgi:Asp-tRNA(Asn)/Glu-tRNA(Gln) amidotransferase C subunit